MGVVTDRALLSSSVIRNDNLTLLQRSASHSFMTQCTKLTRVCWNYHFHIFWMIRTGRRILEWAANIAFSAGPMTDFAFDDLANVGSVMDPVGPFCDLYRVARRAICGALIFRLIGRDIGYGISAIVAILIERIDSEKLFCTVR